MESAYIVDEKPTHVPSYCAFIDVLGFSARIKKSYENDKGNDLLQDFVGLLRDCVEQLKKEGEYGYPFYFKSFTDNIVIGHPPYSHDLEMEFGATTGPIMEYPMAMACRGFFIRGGLAFGPLYIDEISVYGCALLDAHDLESKHASTPIVLLSEDVRKIVDKHLKYYAGEGAPHYKEVLKRADGKYFLSYLSVCIVEDDEFTRLDSDRLLLHKQRINESLAEHQGDQKVWSKFSWLAGYHNFFCQQFSHLPGYSSELLITSSFEAVELFKLEKSD